jgi:hypothetical protein
MAQLTALEIINKVLDNAGLSQVSVLTSLTDINLTALNMIQSSLQEIAMKTTWKQLEASGSLTMVTGTQTYAKPSDFFRVDRNSFIYDSSGTRPKYLDPQELDRLVSDQDATGQPSTYIWEVAGNFLVYRVPTAAYNGKIITYRYWKIPARIDTAVPTGNVWIPEPFDELVLVNYATARLMSYMTHPEAQVYSALVYGTGAEPGALKEMKKAYSSPSLFRPQVRAIF